MQNAKRLIIQNAKRIVSNQLLQYYFKEVKSMHKLGEQNTNKMSIVQAGLVTLISPFKKVILLSYFLAGVSRNITLPIA